LKWTKEKQCSKCGNVYPLTREYFHARKNGKDGYRNDCKECRKQLAQKYYRDNSEGMKEKSAQYYANNKEKVIKRTTDYYFKNKDKILAGRPKYLIKNRDKIKKRVKKYYLNNRSHILSKNSEYREDNPEKIKEMLRCHRKRNPELYKFYSQQYRARKRKLEHDLTKEEREETLVYFGHKCAYCGEDNVQLQQDHIIPVTKGGGYTKRNIIPACASCNSSKHNFDVWEWYKRNPFYDKVKHDKIRIFIEQAVANVEVEQ